MCQVVTPLLYLVAFDVWSGIPTCGQSTTTLLEVLVMSGIRCAAEETVASLDSSSSAMGGTQLQTSVLDTSGMQPQQTWALTAIILICQMCMAPPNQSRYSWSPPPDLMYQMYMFM